MAKKKRPGQDYAAARLERLVEARPLVREQGVALPEVKAPSLEGLKVKVAPVGPVTEHELVGRFAMLRRELATRRDRAFGEVLQPGDDVKLDVVGYHQGKLIPFSARMGRWAPLVPHPELPGFFEALAGNPLGDGLQLDLELPADHPVERLRGQPARFLVDVREAREVTFAAEDDPALLEALGRGSTLDEVMAALKVELEAEHADLQLMVGEEAVLDALAARLEVTLPKGLVNEEITRRWSDLEGQALEQRKFSPEERHEALAAWLADPGTRAETERRLRIALALGAVARRDKLALTTARVKALAALVGAAHGVAAEDAEAALHDSKAATEKLVQTAWHLLAVEHVMGAAHIAILPE